MKRLLFWVAAGGLVAQAVSASGQSSAPYRREVEGVRGAGWHQIALDAAAQRDLATAWLGDRDGNPQPFLREADLPRGESAIAVERWKAGHADDGAWVAEFSLATDTSVIRASIENGNVGAMELTFDVEASERWIAEAEIARTMRSGEWLTLPERQHLFRLGGEMGERLTVVVPCDANEWRVRLRLVQGTIFAVRKVGARTRAAMGGDAARIVPAKVEQDVQDWRVTLGEALRVAGLRVRLSGVVAPVSADVFVEDRDDRGRSHLQSAGSGQIWRMPGLNSEEGVIRFDRPMMAEQLRVKVPAGVLIADASVEVREEGVWFVAEAGERYAMHFGGRPKHAVGSLAALPERWGDESPPPVRLGPPSADPLGTPVSVAWEERLKRGLPWGIGVVVAMLGLLAWRLLQRAPAN